MTSDIDDDLESQPDEERVDDLPREKKRRRALLWELNNKLWDMPEWKQRLWVATHRTDKSGDSQSGSDFMYLVPLPGAIAEYPLHDKEFMSLHEFAERVRREFYRSDSHLRGSTLDEIPNDPRSPFLLQGVIPTNEITAVYGRPKDGKSSWVHKLAISVAIGLPFDGEPVTYGRVLCVSLDPDARKRNVKPRMMEILGRLGAEPNKNLVLVDDPVILDDPKSVEALLQKNPGEFALVVIDPLYKALSGDASQANIMSAAIEGLKRIATETGAAVVVVHHQGRGDDKHPFGSIFLDAGVDSLIHVSRKDNRVTVKVQEMKNSEPRETPLVYDLQGAFLQSVTAPVQQVAAPGVVPGVSSFKITRPDIAALIPDIETSKPEARKRIAQFLTGEDRAREKQWERLRRAWEDEGVIVQTGRTIRRIREVTQ